MKLFIPLLSIWKIPSVFPGPDIIHHRLVIVVDLLDSKRRIFPSRHVHRILDHSQRPQTQEVHFQKAQFLQRRHGKLSSDRPVRCP